MLAASPPVPDAFVQGGVCSAFYLMTMHLRLPVQDLFQIKQSNVQARRQSDQGAECSYCSFEGGQL